MFVFATAMAVLGTFGAFEEAAGKACWLALLGGLIVAVPTAGSGFADWVALEWGSPAWRTATQHLAVMVSAVVLFAVAAWLQHRGYKDGIVTAGGLVASIVGLVVLTVGGWLGGSVVFVHGVRVRAAADAAASPRDADDDHGMGAPTTSGGSRQ